MFTLDDLKFLDSYQFLDASLDTLINNLIVSNHSFKIFNSFFKHEKNRYLLKRKGVFPYSYMDSPEKLDIKGLPPREAFLNVLNQNHITDADYAHATLVYRAFNCQKFGDYLKLYQNTDVVMLAEVFCSFRNISLKWYALDPVHYLSISELTFDASLKLCKIELKLLGNINDYIWFKSQMRGGICLVGKRFAKANNPLLPKSYDCSKPISYILALDAVNLYGFAMSKPLPYGEFYWLNLNEIENFNLDDITLDSNIGYVLEVDLEILSSQNERQNDWPMAPEHLTITYEMPFPYSKQLCTKFNLKNTLPYAQIFFAASSRSSRRPLCTLLLLDGFENLSVFS
ncbi:hypothetical protein AVEN_44589-1 [Araneus ventricosus]|uniref:Uncharacterized protein n=1 Tax=Araneus ventricosus TaxID=182803 RepID=A0A4Y2NNF2_ARAVE|nr:hypothetical protein AVEN_44589-1 [Araneus ventricosus]